MKGFMRKLKFLKIIFTLLIITLSFLFSFFPVIKVNAYEVYEYGWKSPKYDLDFGDTSYNDTWVTQIHAAVESWNATDTPVNITNKASAKNKIYAGSYNDTWYGLYSADTYWFFGTHVTSFEIKLNAITIADDAQIWNNFVRSVLVHELGHSLKLDHNSRNDSIMNSARNRNTMFTPQADDINGVNAIYG